MQDEKKNNRVLLTGTITYAIGTFGTKILSFLIVPLYTYYIEPSDLGDYDLLITTVSLLSPLLTMKISEATYRWIIRKRENEIPYISATYKLLLRNCIICVLLLLIINYFIPIWNCYYFIAILVGDRVLECLQKLLRGVRNQKLFAMSGLFHTTILVISNFIKICYFKEGITALLESNIISIYSTIILILFFEKRLRIVNLNRDYQNEQKEMLSYSIPLVPSALGWWVMNASDRYIIRWLIESEANGIYSIAYKFPSVLQTIFNLFNNAWTDVALAELDKGEKSKQYVKLIFQQFYKVSFEMTFVLIPVTKLIMRLILSDAYKEAAIYIGFLYLGTVFQGFSTFCNIGYLYGKKTTRAAKSSILGAIVNITIDLLCVRFIGLFAASISTFTAFFVMWLFRMRDIKEIFPIRINYKIFMSYFITGIILAIIIIWTNNLIDFCMTVVFGVFFLINNYSFGKKIYLDMIKK